MKFEKLARDRDNAIIDAVMNNKWDKVRKYARKYRVPLPPDRKAMKAGVYKAAQYCTNIPEHVKAMAMMKCLELGFNPIIEPYELDEYYDYCPRCGQGLEWGGEDE